MPVAVCQLSLHQRLHLDYCRAAGGYAPLSNTMSVLGVPVMSKGSFTPTQSDIGEWWHQKLDNAMIDAGKQEMQ